jgi:hypothetical protein
VTITGTAFTGAKRPKFGSTLASFMVDSPTSISAVSPPEGRGEGTRDRGDAGGTSATAPGDRFSFESKG